MSASVSVQLQSDSVKLGEKLSNLPPPAPGPKPPRAVPVPPGPPPPG